MAYWDISTIQSDTSTISTVAASAAQYGITINVPQDDDNVPQDDAVALGGTGDADGDGVVNGLFNANLGYVFDPAGADGWLFGMGPDMVLGTEDDNSDELLRFTGYYITGNFMNAVGIGQGTMTTCSTDYVMGDDPNTNNGQGNGCLYNCVETVGGEVDSCMSNCSFLSVEQCVDDAAVAVLTSFGCPAEVAGGIACLVLMQGVMQETVFLQVKNQVTCVLGGITWAVGAAQVATGGAWMFPNDSDHDVNLTCIEDSDLSDCTGRLLMEVDNLCLPRTLTQRVDAGFKNTEEAHGWANPVFMPTNEGWNMVGLPIYAGGYPYNYLFGIDLNGDGTPDTPAATAGTLYSFDDTGYQPKEIMEPGQGYWLRFDAPCCDPAIYGVPGHPLLGYNILTQTFSLSAGWNMISGISKSANLAADVDDPGGILVDGSLYGFGGGYLSSNTIDPGQAYWVRATEAGDITIAMGAGGTDAGNRDNGSDSEGTPVLPFQEFSSTVNFAGGTSEYGLTFGFSPNATDGYDDGFDQYAPTRSAPTGILMQL